MTEASRAADVPALTLAELVGAFVDRTLPKPLWTHHAHLRVGLWHVDRYGPSKALALLRERIQRYNVSVGGVNTDTDGYHESITRLYVAVIAEFLQEVDRTRSMDDLANELVAQRGQRDLPFRYYSKSRLMSVAARRGWVEPDREPIPPCEFD